MLEEGEEEDEDLMILIASQVLAALQAVIYADLCMQHNVIRCAPLAADVNPDCLFGVHH
jgi:hypothetical protein